MNTRSTAMLTVLIMLFSSMAGCLDRSEDEETDALGTAMVSTYHVGQLVSAIGGDLVNVEMMSPSNVPVHDYEPSAADLVRLQSSDIFFYHGLNLEPWVESALTSLGNDAPTSVQTHAMPTGETALDYESMLISDLCDLLTNGPFESTTLAMGEEEYHNDDDDGHDNDSHDDHDDGHDNDSHDDHDDGHEGHDHAEAEETIENPEGCPTDTVISIFHMGEGEHVLEFEEDHHEDFNMAVLKMPGGHAHHHHDDHDDHDNSTENDEDHDEHGEDNHHDGVCHNTTTHENYDSIEADCEAAGHMWMEDDDHDDHHDGVCHNTTTHENYDSTEADCEAAGHVWMEEEHHDYPEIHADYEAHSLSFPEEMVCYDMSTHTVNGSLVSQADCEAAGLMWTAADSGPDDDDDDHADEEGHHEAGYVVVHIEEEGDYGFAMPNAVEFHVLEGDHDDHDDHDGHEDEGDGHDDEGDDHDDEGDDHDDGEIVAHNDEEFDYDPHSWLDPLAFIEQSGAVWQALTTAFPSGESEFTANAADFASQLEMLHTYFHTQIPEDDSCKQTKVIANHNAYNYMAKRYGLEFISIHGIDPEGEPSAADIAEAVEEINEGGITVLFVEEFTSISAVDSIVEQTVSDTMPDGVSVEYLYTMELPPKDPSDDYISLMRKNVDSLKNGLGC